MENSGVFFLDIFSLKKHKINEEIERHESMPWMNTNLAQSRGKPMHFRTQNYRSLMLGYQKGKMAEKPLKTAKKHYLSLARKSFKNQENISRKREAENIL